MKLIFENWRSFLNENLNISESSKRLLAMLINLKKFKNIQDFVSRTKLLINGSEEGFAFNLLIDDKLAGMVYYRALEKFENCRPKPYGSKTTYMLTNIARDGSFKGFGVGRLISFLSACYISGIDGTITSDRNTSDKAGKQLVDSLKMIGAKESSEFDYVGFFVNELYDLYFDNKGNLKTLASDFIAPRSDKTGIASMTRHAHNAKLKKEFNKKLPELIKKVIKHLKPLTPELSDDCEPSSNIMITDNVAFSRILRDKSLPAFLEKVLTMSSEELQEFFNSDDRVQGYTFTLPDTMIDAGIEIINSINASHQYSDDEMFDFTKSSGDMFDRVYRSEIGARGRARKEET